MSSTEGESSEAPIFYAIRLAPRVLEEIDAAAVRFTELGGDDIAAAWRAGLRAEIAGLAQNPRRHPLVPESRHFRQETRQVMYRRTTGSAPYRLLFQIQDDGPDGRLVLVFHLRHGAAKPITRKEAGEIQAGEAGEV